MSYARRIIDEKFGGTTKLARLSGWPPTTVQSWKVAGEIPPPRQRELLKLARENGIKLTPADFFATEESPAPRRAAQ